MPSPFPGMNPYLEQADAWHDFHERFIPVAAELIESCLGSSYYVKLDEHLYIHEPAADERILAGRGDAFVAHLPSGSVATADRIGAAAPARVHIPAVDMESLSYLEIRDRRDKQVVTVLELLSPSNKNPGPDRQQYLAKRGQLLSSPAHFVELDLLRGGPRMPFADLPPCDYYALLSRVEERPEGGVWPIHLPERLPKILIPLRAPDADVTLDLQQALHRVYDASGYRKYIYEGSPEPPLTSEQSTWATQILSMDR